MYQVSINPNLLLIVLSAGLALLFDWVPGVATWFNALAEGTKRLVNAGILLLVSAILFGGQCGGLFSTNYTCDAKGALDMLIIWFTAVTINQGVHFGTKPSAELKARIVK